MLSRTDILLALEEVKDPEIPSISVVDLGIVTDVQISEDNHIHVVLTPTFSGCPALKWMEEMVAERIQKMPEVKQVDVTTSFDVPWNTNLITEKGLAALKRHGLAPPPRHDGSIDLDVLSETPCPYCGSHRTTLENPFGPTLCRSMHYCHECLQAFEGFKPVC